MDRFRRAMVRRPDGVSIHQYTPWKIRAVMRSEIRRDQMRALDQNGTTAAGTFLTVNAICPLETRVAGSSALLDSPYLASAWSSLTR